MKKYRGVYFRLKNLDRISEEKNNPIKNKKSTLEHSTVIEAIGNFPNHIEGAHFDGIDSVEDVDRLKEYVSLSRKKRIHSKWETDCVWAENPDYTYEILKDLKSTGLAGMMINYDRTLVEKENFERVENVIDAANRVRLNTKILVTNTENLNIGKLIDSLGKKILNINIVVLKDRKKMNKTENKDKRNIYKELLFVDYDGNIYENRYGQLIDSIYSDNGIEKILNME